MEKYQKIEKIGEGTYGVVYKAKNRALYEWCIVNLRASPENVPEICKAIVSSFGIEDREVRTEALVLLKKLAKKPGFVTGEGLDATVAAVLDKALDKKSYPVKMAAERVLLYLILKQKAVAGAWVKTQDEKWQKEISTFVARVLSKLPAESDDEQ